MPHDVVFSGMEPHVFRHFLMTSPVQMTASTLKKGKANIIPRCRDVVWPESD